MCGIAGFIERRAVSDASGLEDISRMMARVQAHRGPDDEGVWTDIGQGIALAQRRLAVIDLDSTGHQPMISASGRFVIVYNGEVYNYRAIEGELRSSGHDIVGGSDTAVILAAISAWGVVETVKRCIGMFAFAVWDRERQCLTLARDRLGIKPLYWFADDALAGFSSQPKAFHCHPGFTPRVDAKAVSSFVRHGYIPAPWSIYEGIAKLEPGHVVTIPRSGTPEIVCYWNLRTIAAAGISAPFEGSPVDASDTAHNLLKAAVHDRMIADVPLGVFLSGGVDSSTIAALMQSISHSPVRTFSIGFEQVGYDESAHARAVAAHLGTDHTELTVTPSDALDLVNRLPEWYDEPFADSSQIPTLLLSKLTRGHVTVALSGDGGDEVFAGYNRYAVAERLWNTIRTLPRSLRYSTSALAGTLPPGLLNGIGNAMPIPGMPRQIGDKLHKLAGILTASDLDEVYRRLISQWPEPQDAVVAQAEHHSMIWDQSVIEDRPDGLGRMQLMDMSTYLPDDILVKVDRASMAFALEARVPILDHRVVEFAWSLPRSYLIREGKTKAPLRDILARYVPPALTERPKMGFGVPLDNWLRGPLRDWAEDLLSESALREDGLFNIANIRHTWETHLTGRRNNSYSLWTILMYQSWARCRYQTP